jgi:hypothetical protein
MEMESVKTDKSTVTAALGPPLLCQTPSRVGRERLRKYKDQSMGEWRAWKNQVMVYNQIPWSPTAADCPFSPVREKG